MAPTETTYAGRAKYTEDRSRRYQKRPPGKHRAEMKLIDRAFVVVPKTHRVLDVPCGGGRVTIHLARRGYAMTAADLSESMVKIARESLAKSAVKATVDQQDIEKLGYPDKAFDTIVSFRLFHHFPNADIRRRVAAQNVVLSYFSPLSFTSVRNKLRETFGGKKTNKYPTSLAEITGYFKEHGFRLVKDIAQLPLLHTLHAAVFERVEGKSS